MLVELELLVQVEQLEARELQGQAELLAQEHRYFRCYRCSRSKRVKWYFWCWWYGSFRYWRSNWCWNIWNIRRKGAQAQAERAEQPEQPELLVHLEQAVLPEQAQTIHGRVRTAQEQRIRRINAYRITAQDMFAYLQELVNSQIFHLLTGTCSVHQEQVEQREELELPVQVEQLVLQGQPELLAVQEHRVQAEQREPSWRSFYNDPIW